MAKLIDNCLHHTIDENGTVINTKTNHVKSHWIGANGYYHVDIQENGISTKKSLHRLLALTFIPNPENKRTVNHIDGNKLNNSLDNLEWATDKENVCHAYSTGLQPYKRKHTLEEYEQMLETFLSGISLTDISYVSSNNLTQLSYHIREAAERLNKTKEYEAELISQRGKRMAKVGLERRNHITLNMIDRDTNEILKTFSSVTEAKLYLNKKSCGPISNVLAGRQKSAYGYFWEKI